MFVTLKNRIQSQKDRQRKRERETDRVKHLEKTDLTHLPLTMAKNQSAQLQDVGLQAG